MVCILKIKVHSRPTLTSRTLPRMVFIEIDMPHRLRKPLSAPAVRLTYKDHTVILTSVSSGKSVSIPM